MILKPLFRYGISLTLVLPMAISSAVVIAQQAGDRNIEFSSTTADDGPDNFDSTAFSEGTSRSAPTIASATIVPSSSSAEITIEITNRSQQSTIGPREIRAVILDCHRADNKRSLTIDAISSSDPRGGKAEIAYGSQRDDVGPAVVLFQGFNNGEKVRLTIDPDTWGSGAFVASPKDMAGCLVELVFFPRGNLRGDGTMKILRGGSVQAAIIQRRQ